MGIHLTLATATGLSLLFLALHVAAAAVALVAGFVAVLARKGGAWHRRAGLAFVFGMIASGIMATGISLYEGKATFIGGALSVYLVFTAWTTVRPLKGSGRRVDIALMVAAFAFAALGFTIAVIAFERPGHQINGVPAGMMFFLNTIVVLAALGDARMIRAGGIRGSRRLARHLWRMCFGLFIASGSFFLGQMKFIPAPVRSVPVLMALAIAPLILLVYWMWRVRLRQNLRGMMLANEVARSPDAGVILSSS